MAGLTHSPRIADQAAGGQNLLVRLLLRGFQLPGNLVADRIGARSEDDRMMIRMLIGILFWNLVIVVAAWFIYSSLG
ncbi:MAG: hypothetical protein IRY87_37130 [Acetobacteraceae bacterium]|nr:hypothetical protein [Acetobacteraceae bacterium]